MGATTDETAPATGGPVLAPPHRRSARPGHRILWRHSGRVAEPTVDQTELRVAAERQRIAGALHDDVSSALFAIAANVERAQSLHGDDVDELRRALARVGELATDASDKLRAVLRSCTPVEPAEGVPAAAQRDLDDLAERSGVAAHLVVRGRLRPLPAWAERVMLNCLRQALFNIERHAGARTVFVTLQYTPDEAVLVVQDDGRGLPAGFEPRVVPEAGHHWGTASIARQVEQRGGSVELTGTDEGGARLRVRIPA